MIPIEHNDIIVFMFKYDQKTGYLVPGIHHARWCDIAPYFAGNSCRMRLLGGLLRACCNLATAGCRKLLLDGSFVSTKKLPGDYDAAWDTTGVNPNRLDPILLDYRPPRTAMKAKYLGDLFPAQVYAEPGTSFVRFFQTDRNGVKKGIVLIDLESLP